MDHHSGYRDGLVTEYRSHVETGQPERARAVLDELERTGGIPEGLDLAAWEDTAESGPQETAVTSKRAARQRKAEGA